MNAPLLRLEQVSLARGGRRLFDRLDLQLGAGDALQLRGPNGSGKSSLIRLAAGLLQPVAGTVTRGTLALADDRLALDEELPLARALRFWLSPNRIAGGLDMLDLTILSDVPVRLLSSGQRQRAALARVAASGAELWLLDEPLNALDAGATAALASSIADHRARGGAVLAASHLPMGEGWRVLDLPLC